MQFYKKTPETNNNNEYLKMTSIIKSDPINNVCFECGTKNPQYISINNAIFICKDCVVNHLSFSHEISQIIVNDLYSLNLSEIKTLYFGGNRKLIQFINLDFPDLKQLPPEILYKTIAVDYYRQYLKFFVNGGKKPLRPNKDIAYKLIEFKDKLNEKNYFNYTELTPILEGNDEADEKDFNEEDNSFIEKNKNVNDDTKNESTLVNTPQKNNNDINNNIENIINKYTNKNKENDDKDEKKEELKENLNINEEIKFNTDKNISEIINNEENNKEINNDIDSNRNNNDENSGDDNTIRIVNGYINISRENEISDFKSNKEKDDSSNSLIKEKTEEKLQENKNQNEIEEKYENKIKKKKNDIRNNETNINNKKKIKTENIIETKKRKNNINNDDEKDEIRYNNKTIKSKNEEKNDLLMGNKKEKNIYDKEENQDINYNNIKSDKCKKNNDRNIIIIKKEKKPSKNIIIKTKEYSEEEESSKEEEESEEEEEIKSAQINYSKRPDNEKIERLNITEIKPNKHLRAKISSSHVFKFNDKNEKYKGDNNPTIKLKKMINKKESSDKHTTSKEMIKKKDLMDDEDDFFSKKSSFGSGFINPLKYLQKSFQKKQNEKFENDSNSSEEDSYEEEELNNKNMKYIDDKEDKYDKTKKRNEIYKFKKNRKNNNNYINKEFDDDINSSNSEETD